MSFCVQRHRLFQVQIILFVLIPIAVGLKIGGHSMNPCCYFFFCKQLCRSGSSSRVPHITAQRGHPSFSSDQRKIQSFPAQPTTGEPAATAQRGHLSFSSDQRGIHPFSTQSDQAPASHSKVESKVLFSSDQTGFYPKAIAPYFRSGSYASLVQGGVHPATVDAHVSHEMEPTSHSNFRPLPTPPVNSEVLSAFKIVVEGHGKDNGYEVARLLNDELPTYVCMKIQEMQTTIVQDIKDALKERVESFLNQEKIRILNRAGQYGSFVLTYIESETNVYAAYVGNCFAYEIGVSKTKPLTTIQLQKDNQCNELPNELPSDEFYGSGYWEQTNAKNPSFVVVCVSTSVQKDQIILGTSLLLDPVRKGLNGYELADTVRSNRVDPIRAINFLVPEPGPMEFIEY